MLVRRVKKLIVDESLRAFVTRATISRGIKPKCVLIPLAYAVGPRKT